MKNRLKHSSDTLARRHAPRLRRLGRKKVSYCGHRAASSRDPARNASKTVDNGALRGYATNCQYSQLSAVLLAALDLVRGKLGRFTRQRVAN